jgi:hypothetical protein
MAVANGTLMRVYVNGSVINCEVNGSFDTSFSTDKVACKDTPNGEQTPGPIDFSFSGEALVELSPSGNGVVTLLNLHKNKTTVSASFIASEAGGFTIAAADCLITQMNVSGGTEESGRFTFTITGSGDYTVS